ncbi:hypothetical protein CRX72_11785 [Pantoea sp. BRM17]|nr:hypothetical protein CRX72_11785 [Pantoea sp. BRM17]
MMPADFSGTRWAADIHITPDGRSLYACDRTSSTITVFSVSEAGDALTIEGHQPNETLLVPALKQDRICRFQLHQDGTLTPHAQADVNTAAGAGPRHMAFHPGGAYGYVVNELNSTVDV